MHPTRTLFAKELRQHGGALLGMTALLATAFGLGKVLMSREARVLSALEAVSSFALGPLVAAALYLGHRLVVAEHFGRTQRFVEALPVRRGHLALVKAAFGLCWLELWAGLALLLGAAGATTEPLGARFLGILAARLSLYVLALWGVIFLLGFFGRLRFVLGVALVVLLIALDRATAWDLDTFGPYRADPAHQLRLRAPPLPGPGPGAVGGGGPGPPSPWPGPWPGCAKARWWRRWPDRCRRAS